MRRHSFQAAVGVRTAIEVPRRMLIDLVAADKACGGDGTRFASMLDIIEGGAAALQAISALASASRPDHAVPFVSVRLLSLLPVPARLRDAGMFVAHLENIRREFAKIAGRGEADPEAAALALLEIDQFKLPGGRLPALLLLQW